MRAQRFLPIWPADEVSGFDSFSLKDSATSHISDATFHLLFPFVVPVIRMRPIPVAADRGEEVHTHVADGRSRRSFNSWDGLLGFRGPFEKAFDIRCQQRALRLLRFVRTPYGQEISTSLKTHGSRVAGQLPLRVNLLVL